MITFKQTTTMTGVYAIRCLVTQKRYVGSATRSFRHRWYKHRYLLRKNAHHSPTLQRAWNKYGEDQFRFEIIEVTEPLYAVAMEQVYIDYYRAGDRHHGFNVAAFAGSSRGCFHTEEMKRLSSAARKGQRKSESTREKMRQGALLRADLGKCAERLRHMNQSRVGMPLTDEHKAKISAGGKGLKRTEETKQKMRKPRPPEVHVNMSAAAKERCKNPEYIQKLRDAANRNAAKRKEARTH